LAWYHEPTAATGAAPDAGTGSLRFGNRGGALAFSGRYRSGGRTMLYWTLIFLVVALVAGLFGFGGIASASAGIAKILFAIFLVLFLGAVFIGLAVGKKLTS
jgi:uncharacterized membrane protein YtjA (UPF0391 family)